MTTKRRTNRTIDLKGLKPKRLAKDLHGILAYEITVGKRSEFKDLRSLPVKHGVVVVSGRDGDGNNSVVYIGRGGWASNPAKSKRNRAKNSSQGIRSHVFSITRGALIGEKFWLSILNKPEVEELVFQWAITGPEKGEYTLPRLVQAKLLQAHLDATGRLPAVNRYA